MAKKNFSAKQLDAMFDAAVKKGLVHLEEDSKVKQIKRLLEKIGLEKTADWEKLVFLLADEPKFSVENFDDILTTIADGLSCSDKVTYIALEALWLFLEQSQSFRLSLGPVQLLVTLLYTQILGCGTGSHNIKKDYALLCLKSLVHKSFNNFGGALWARLVELIAVECGQVELYNSMLLWSRDSLDQIGGEVGKKYIEQNPLLLYLSMIGFLGEKENFDPEITIYYESNFNMENFIVEWTALDKRLGQNFLDFVKGILFESVLLQPLCGIGGKIIGALAVLFLPAGQWEDFEHMLLENLEIDDVNKNNQIMLILQAIPDPWELEREMCVQKLVNDLFPIVFKKLKTHTAAALTISQMVRCHPSCVMRDHSRMKIMQQLASWISAPTASTSTGIEKVLNDQMRFILGCFINFEEKSASSDLNRLEKLKSMARFI